MTWYRKRRQHAKSRTTLETAFLERTYCHTHGHSARRHIRTVTRARADNNAGGVSVNPGNIQ